MRGLVYLVFALTSAGAAQGADLPKVLFFANPMGSDNDVIRRTRPEVLSVAERYFVELSKGVFDVTITQDGAKVTAEALPAYKGVVFFTAIIYVMWRTLKVMPRTKPQQIKPASNQAVTFADIAGVDDAKAELQEIVEFLREPKSFHALGAQPLLLVFPRLGVRDDALWWQL